MSQELSTHFLSFHTNEKSDKGVPFLAFVKQLDNMSIRFSKEFPNGNDLANKALATIDDKEDAKVYVQWGQSHWLKTGGCEHSLALSTNLTGSELETVKEYILHTMSSIIAHSEYCKSIDAQVEKWREFKARSWTKERRERSNNRSREPYDTSSI